MSTPALNPLVEKIRAKYPGSYDDMDDAALTKAILAKYPSYADLARPNPATDPGLQPKNPLQGVTGEDLLGPTRDTFSQRIGTRIQQNLEGLPQLPGEIVREVKSAATSPHTLSAIPRNIGAALSQYKDPANIAGDLITGYVAGKAGAPAEAEEAPKTAPRMLADAQAAKQLNLPQVPTLAGRLLREIPGVGSVLRKYDLLRSIGDALQQKQSSPELPKPQVPPWWGKENVGPPEQWGKEIPQPPPETTSIRRGPGQIAPEMIRPRAYTVNRAQPIPPRQGLALPGQVEVPPQPPVAPPSIRRVPGQIPPEMIRPRAYSPYSAEPIPQRQGLALPGQVEAPPETPTAPVEHVPTQNAPYTYTGESALRQILTGQDNKALLQIAKSRGINVTQEAQLKPGIADGRIINKIIDDFKPEELDELRDSYLENNRIAPHLGDIGPEAWKTLNIQTYFPEVKLPQSRLARTAMAIKKGQATFSEAPQIPPKAPTADIANAYPKEDIVTQADKARLLFEARKQQQGLKPGMRVDDGGRPGTITGPATHPTPGEAWKIKYDDGSTETADAESLRPLNKQTQTEDLTPQLQKSLEAVKAKKAVNWEPGQAVMDIIANRDRRNWATLPADFEAGAVKAAFSDIKKFFPQTAIRQRIAASKATTFAELRRILGKP